MADAAVKKIYPERAEAPEGKTQPAGPIPRLRDAGLWKKKLPKSNRDRLRWSLFGALPPVLLIGGLWYVVGGGVVSTDDAYVNAEKVGVSTDVSGIVEDVDVSDNQHVAAGHVLYRLEPRQFQIALDNAKANLAQTALLINSMKQDYKHLLSDVAAQQAQVELDQTNFDRQSMLIKSGTTSQAVYDQAKYALQNDTGKLASLRQQAAMQLAKLGGSADIPTDQHPQYLQAKAQVDEAQRQLDHTVVKAPFAGTVTNVPAIAPGKYLAASTTAFYLVDTDHVWVDANPKETELTYVRAGQIGRRDGRYLSGRGVARHGREHEPGGGAGVLAAAGAEHERQLGQGRAARADARARRHQRRDEAAAARRHERRGRRRYRPRPRLARTCSGDRGMTCRGRPAGVNRGAITACVMLATLMQALDTTIANVALPYMQGSVSASQDQIAWVLTSYIVAAAIMTPPIGFLAGRFGRKRLFLTSIIGFTVASMLCGMAQTLTQIVLFRILQGVFGAALVPLSQTMLFNIYPREQHGSAMAMWGIGVMVGPILGPMLGGWLTQNSTLALRVLYQSADRHRRRARYDRVPAETNA